MITFSYRFSLPRRIRQNSLRNRHRGVYHGFVPSYRHIGPCVKNNLSVFQRVIWCRPIAYFIYSMPGFIFCLMLAQTLWLHLKWVRSKSWSEVHKSNNYLVFRPTSLFQWQKKHKHFNLENFPLMAFFTTKNVWLTVCCCFKGDLELSFDGIFTTTNVWLTVCCCF